MASRKALLLDGLGATESICAMLQRQGRRRPPTIAVTANAVEGDRERCLDAGMNAMLKKPFSRQQLLATFELRMGQSAAGDQ